MAVPARRIRRRVTLTEIAQATGVALSTVSRALSNPARVSPKTYELIARKAQELGYESDSLPAVRQRFVRGTIALLVQNLSNPFNYDLLRGAQAQTQAAGYLHLLVNAEDSEPVEANWLKELAGTVDGVVLASPRSDDQFLTRIAATLPLVVVNREVPSLPGIVIDTPGGLAQAADYLASLGHRRIAYVRGPATSWVDERRFLALDEACTRLGVDLQAIGNFHPSISAGAAAADAVALSDTTAAIFFNDTLAIGALTRFAERGIRVPEDMSVVGCDDVFGASFAHPPLTTVTAAGERAGRAATDLLIAQFSSRTRSRRIDRLATHLTVRSSTSSAASTATSALGRTTPLGQ